MLGFQGGVSIPFVKGGVKAPPAKRQCRAGPKAGARRGFTNPPLKLLDAAKYAAEGKRFFLSEHLLNVGIIIFEPQFHHQKFHHLRRRKTWGPRPAESTLSEPRSSSYRTLAYKHMRE